MSKVETFPSSVGGIAATAGHVDGSEVPLSCPSGERTTDSISYALLVLWSFSAICVALPSQSYIEPDAHWMHTVHSLFADPCLKIADRSREQFGCRSYARWLITAPMLAERVALMTSTCKRSAAS